MSPQTDRYVLTGLPVPVITPGTLKSLETLLRTALAASQETPDRVLRIDAIQDDERVCIRRYAEGRDITSLYAED